MPLRLDIKRQLFARSDRVKCVDLHPTEPWLLSSLYSGHLHVWNYETQTMVKSFEVTDVPVRAARFIHRKNWIICASDDMAVRIFNYNTLEKVHTFEAHSDYIRAIAVHPTQPYALTASDDMTIKLWDWDKNWTCKQIFEGHTHYVMSIIFNPKDTNTFASASLDRTIKVWHLGASTPNFTLQGHEKGVNCLDYFQGGEKPYLVSGADDRLVKIWDYQNKTCVQTLDGHTHNVSAVAFHPELPVILTGSEDGTVRVWHANTYRLENTLNYGLERVWTMAHRRGSNNIAIGYDDGSIIIKLGREEPAMSMDSSGKIIWARHNEVQQANVAKLEGDVKDGEPLALGTKDMGSCEIYPQTLKHNPNGRFVVVCGDGEYIIHTALSFRNKSFGQALEFVWAADSSEYAVRESSSKIKIFKNFKERKVVKPDFSAEGIFGGTLLGIRGGSTLCFFDWENTTLIRRIDVDDVRNVFWSDAGDLVAIVTSECFYILSFDADALAEAQASGAEVDEEGYECAFGEATEITESVKTGCWVGDCFVYTNSVNRVNYYVGGEVVTIAHLDRPMYLLGYLSGTNRLYLGDKDLNVVTYQLHLAVIEYQTAVMRGDFATADQLIPNIPKDQRARVAHFLEKQGFKEQALVITSDAEHKFELAMSLKKLEVARDIAKELENDLKWKQLGEAAMRACLFELAEECMEHAKDHSGLLLLYTSSGKAKKIDDLAKQAESADKNNIAFLSYFLQGKLDECVELLVNTRRLPEAALFARTYCPSHVPRIVQAWKSDLAKSNAKAAQSLADPTEYENLFPDYEFGLKAEQFLRGTASAKPAQAYMRVCAERKIPLAERMAAGGGGGADDMIGDEYEEPTFANTEPAAEEAPAAAAAPAKSGEDDLLDDDLEGLLAEGGDDDVDGDDVRSEDLDLDDE